MQQVMGGSHLWGPAEALREKKKNPVPSNLSILQETCLNGMVLKVSKAAPWNENIKSAFVTIAKCCLKGIFSHLLYTCSIIEYQMPSFSHLRWREGPICCTLYDKGE